MSVEGRFGGVESIDLKLRFTTARVDYFGCEIDYIIVVFKQLVQFPVISTQTVRV